ncbi:UDP-3-O-(3-hydroxymyristoyl)glucosamine N-acyltransferase [Wenzhouxiangella sp. XN79A]|uniref:UDP-3-O-(3-hydroxymyristoyl)glucosamine N-acyltransferase n=1 Tax=Wenzhouxiangella sp. XN79A TaxID=2724193 RepID=UPI00144AE732|nr:UDP-3-O-(3-hydroxymyristoyl)glucosamine N-acyltransferase [Wenzhouxiangella sp. XN79A]NKI35005.1 UDP-3-O-(3-hydroxymyristoyl)glucosamine N-acyltransferase [Wenzhouxiangella sp. XN79A]
MPRTPLCAEALARHLDARLVGDGGVELNHPATLAAAGPGALGFLANSAYRSQLRTTGASAVIVSDDAVADCPCTALVVDDPYLAWSLALDRFAPSPRARPGIHPRAFVDPAADVDPGAEIGPMAVVEAEAVIAAGAVVGPGCVVGAGAQLAEDVRLVANVTLGPAVVLGRRTLVHPGVVIGADGFGLAMDKRRGHWRKVAQLGSVRIGADCEIGANTTIDRGAIDDTVLGDDVRLDNQVQVAHNVVIGDHSAIAGCVGIAGSTRIGRYCMIAGASGIGGHLEICDHVVITAMSTVLDSIDRPGAYGSGIPARPMRAWQRILVRLGQLDRLLRRRGTN